MKNKIAALALSAASVAGVGATTFASGADAATSKHYYAHQSAYYATSSACLTNRNGVVASVNRAGGSVRYVGACKLIGSTYIPATHTRVGGWWNYDFVGYSATHAAIKGDYPEP